MSHIPLISRLFLMRRICGVEQVFIPTFNSVARMYEDLEEDEEMISPSQFGILFLDWTNPERVASEYVLLSCCLHFIHH